jgi:hypothetical protein
VVELWRWRWMGGSEGAPGGEGKGRQTGGEWERKEGLGFRLLFYYESATRAIESEMDGQKLLGRVGWNGP